MADNSSDVDGNDVVITDLLSYRLHRVASAFERSAALRFRREHDVSLGEWRALALLAAGKANTLNRLARLAGLDRAQMSRVVTKLGERGLVARSSGPGNSSPISLTEDGVRVYEGLIAAARERNSTFLGSLSEHETATLDAVLDKLLMLAIGMEHAERAAAESQALRDSGVTR
jgi:DNA-binding MarR family transcriptional regulator